MVSSKFPFCFTLKWQVIFIFQLRNHLCQFYCNNIYFFHPIEQRYNSKNMDHVFLSIIVLPYVPCPRLCQPLFEDHLKKFSKQRISWKQTICKEYQSNTIIICRQIFFRQGCEKVCGDLIVCWQGWCRNWQATAWGPNPSSYLFL